MASTGTYYIDTADFSTATAVWIDATLTTKAPDGYYSFEGNYRQQSSGILTAISTCTAPIVCISYNVEIPEVDTVTISYYDCNNNFVPLEALTGPDNIQFCAKEGTVLTVPSGTSTITGNGNCTTPSVVNVYVTNNSSSGYVYVNSVAIDTIPLSTVSGDFPLTSDQNLQGQTTNTSSAANIYVGFSTPTDCPIQVVDTYGVIQCTVSPGGEYFTVDLSGPGALNINVLEQGTACS